MTYPNDWLAKVETCLGRWDAVAPQDVERTFMHLDARLGPGAEGLEALRRDVT